MKYIYTAQESIYDVYNYQFNEDFLKVSHTLKMSETEEVTNDSYYDIGSLELNKKYDTKHPLINIETVEGELVFNLLHAVPTQDKYSAFEPETLDVEFEEFEIPEDAEIIQLEELVVPEPEPSPVDNLKSENHELKNRISSLQSSMMKNQKDTEDLIVSLMMMM